MAANIKGDAAPKKQRGRPSKAQIKERELAQQRLQQEVDRNGGKLPGAEAVTVGGKHTGPPAADPKPPKSAPAGRSATTSAPAFGANRATEGLFLRHVQTLRLQGVEIDKAKASVKAARGKLKDLRNLAKADGIVLGELDEALEALETERVDLLAKEERRVLYFEWLGLPTLRSADSAKIEKSPAKRWNAIGNIDGRLGKPREVPDGCDGAYVQDYLHGWDQGQKALMGELPLTAEGFKDGADPHAAGVAQREEGAGGAAAAPEKPPEAAPVVDPASDGAVGLIQILTEKDFAAGTSLEDANKKTLFDDDVLERWNQAERVVALFDGKKRVLKEPDALIEGGFYEDTGEPDAEVTDPEPATAEDLAAVEGAVAALIEETVAADQNNVENQAEGVAREDSPEPPAQDDPETFH